MKTITIGFSRSKKFLPVGSLAIRAYMRTPYSHVYLRFFSESLNRTLIYEAVGVGVRFIGEKQWSKHAVEVASFEVDITDDNYITLLQYCVDHAGLEYGFMQNVGIPLSKLFNLESNPFQSGSNCPEEIYKILQIAGYKVEGKKDLVTPKDLYKLLSK
jgi:hypothetical protein